jgi:hypothetical protein
MDPADQGLGRVHGRGGQGHLGLVVQAQLTMLDRMAQLAQQRQMLLLAGVELRIIDRVADLAALGDIHRDVGVAHQGLRVRRMFGKQRDSDAGADIERLILEENRPLQRAMMLCASSITCALCSAGTSSANSSPPSRATQPAVPSSLCSRIPTWRST